MRLVRLPPLLLLKVCKAAVRFVILTVPVMAVAGAMATTVALCVPVTFPVREPEKFVAEL